MYLLCIMLPGSLSYNYTYLAPFYVLAMIVFSAVLVARWKHENQQLSYLWGTQQPPANLLRFDVFTSRP